MYNETPRSTKFWLLALLLLVSTSAGLLQLQRDQAPSLPRNTNQPEFKLEDFILTRMDTAGNPNYRLQANAMIHYKKKQESHLENPDMTIFKGDAPPWRIQSEQGLITGNGDYIELQNRVEIKRRAGKSNQAMQVITRNLSIHTKTSIATTQEQATLTSPGQKISGVGMKLYFKRPGKIILSAKVRGTHETH